VGVVLEALAVTPLGTRRRALTLGERRTVDGRIAQHADLFAVRALQDGLAVFFADAREHVTAALHVAIAVDEQVIEEGILVATGLRHAHDDLHRDGLLAHLPRIRIGGLVDGLHVAGPALLEALDLFQSGKDRLLFFGGDGTQYETLGTDPLGTVLTPRARIGTGELDGSRHFGTPFGESSEAASPQALRSGDDPKAGLLAAGSACSRSPTALLLPKSEAVSARERLF